MNWATIAELGTAFGTIILAAATFVSVRAGNRAARLSERSLLDDTRPLLLQSKLQDAEEKVGFADDHWVHVPGGHGIAEVIGDNVYLAIAVRNVGEGGQRVVTRFSMVPTKNVKDGWLAVAVRHWNLDRTDPRSR